MARTKTRSDEQVLDTALDLMSRHGPGGLTFATLAAGCGLAPATLVQRFATKETLVKRTLARAWDLLDAATADAAARTPRTPAGAVALLLGLSGQYDGIDTYQQGILLLREDVRDPDLRRRGVAWEAVLTDALDRRLSPPGDTRTGLGHALAAYWQGAIVWWAFRADQPLVDHLAPRLAEFVALLGAAPLAPDPPTRGAGERG